MKHIKLTKKNYLIMTPILVIKIFGDILGDYVRTIATGVAPLKHQNSVIGNPRDKAEILNDQFYSVSRFTHEDLSDLSQSADPAYSSIPDVSFSTDGIYIYICILKLIKSLNINKASGPDNISARVLTICAEEIAPILTILFTQSFNSGELPNDWLTANITLSLRRVIKVTLLITAQSL